jgi:RNA polymerase sigma factor (TIGR02999 family)
VDVTELARRWSEGDDASFDRLIERTYPTLRRIAERHLSGDPEAALDATELVHEAFLRFARGSTDGHDWPDRAHFYAFCARAMRNTLVDAARRRATEKRGGAWIRVPLRDSDADAAIEREATDLLHLDEALSLLEEKSPRMSRIVECRFFAGLSIAETAEVVGASARTVVREWTRARAYLLHIMESGPGGPTGPEGERT